MDQARWRRWVLQTATKWEDLSDIVSDIGLERIDREHHHLITLILDMDDSNAPGSSLDIDSRQVGRQEQLFKQFLDNTQDHYQTEEDYIERYNLPGKEQQLAQHGEILETFNQIVKDFEEGILSTFQDMRIELLENMLNHINKYDNRTFRLKNFSSTLENATRWEDISEIITGTGIPFVDDEHKQLTGKIIFLNRFLDDIDFTITTDIQKQTILTLLDELYRFTEMHFLHEIEFLTKYHLDTGVQDAAHDFFLTTLLSARKDVLADKSNGLKKFVQFLLNWWVQHINGIDYREFKISRFTDAIFTRAIDIDELDWVIRKTGIEQIDKEHTQLLQSILDICTLSGDEDKNSDIKGLLENLFALGVQHFQHEEKIMAELKLKGIAEHHQAHVKLLQIVENSAGHVIAGRSQVSPSFRRRLVLWLVDHTNEIDYETFVLNRKVKQEDQ